MKEREEISKSPKGSPVLWKGGGEKKPYHPLRAAQLKSRRGKKLRKKNQGGKGAFGARKGKK